MELPVTYLLTFSENKEVHAIDSEWSELIRCKDCKHRPKRTGDEGTGFDFEFPDEMCPCHCEDGWYNRMPKDNWFCANGERKEE